MLEVARFHASGVNAKEDIMQIWVWFRIYWVLCENNCQVQDLGFIFTRNIRQSCLNLHDFAVVAHMAQVKPDEFEDFILYTHVTCSHNVP
jgi:hypothetical protein